MLRKLIVGTIVWAALTTAHDVITTPITFSREISRLVNSRCASCHHEGGSAFSLLTYADARPWAKAIKEEVLERRMPPWGAIKGFGEFRDDRGLTQEQIELIAEWVEGGAPEGDDKLLPKVPDFGGRAAPENTPPGIAVEGTLTLKSALTLAGIRPTQVPEGSSLMVVATRPDGSVEPLLWLYEYKPKFSHAYWYRAGLPLPAGTKIEVTPARSGVVALLTRTH
jgi:hypothetical protein